MPLIILDRDGVLNYDSDAYIKKPEEWLPLPGSMEAVARLNRADYRVVVLTNQSGIARGFFDIDTLNRIHEKMRHCVLEAGGEIEAVFFCPHGPRSTCNCRKPKPGMFQELAARLDLDSLHGVPAVGDSLRDLQAAAEVGATPVLVKTGKGTKTLSRVKDEGFSHVPVYDDLSSVVDALLA